MEAHLLKWHVSQGTLVVEAALSLCVQILNLGNPSEQKRHNKQKRRPGA